ncbi:MAG: MFS transporter [Bacteroidales bacterium]|nr:MFS transporter [Porphyromonas sp.]MDD6934022.1 MFS transporter [Bacteroidales bacterium]MDY3103024.1 MFS transporter [Porphyromonas sp.]
MTQAIQQSLRDKAWARWTVLVLIALTMFFAYMFVDVLSPLKSMLEKTAEEGGLGWSSTVFGTYGSSEFFLNVFFFFLIFAGIILDKMGVRFTAVLSGALMVIGALIKVYALSATFNGGGFGFDMLNSFMTTMPPSAKLACVGFMIFGCGCEMGGVTVSRAIVKWFEGKEMALAMGLEMAVARLGVFAVFRMSAPIAEHFQSVQAPVILCLILLCIGLLFYLIYGIFDARLEKTAGNLKEAEEEEPFRFKDLGKVFGSGIFWIVALLCVLYYSAIFPFQKFATGMLETNLGLSAETASAIFSYFPIGAMIITPFLGAFLDFKGKGATMLMLGSILMIICHTTFALFPFQTGDTLSTVVAYSAIVLLGVSFSLVPAALWPSMPKLIDAKVLGSAYSATFWIQNVGLMITPIVIGSVLDATGGKYYLPMLIFASFGVAALLLSLYLKAVDKKKGYGLELPNKKK